ncbi:MAG TPA: hypothetical protein VIW29_19000 [Polyangiaceae bacterium]
MTQDGVFLGNHPISKREPVVEGRLVERAGETYYRIEHAEALPPFLTSVVSDADHWLFVGSNGALTAGRQSSKLALFPYTTEDKLLDGVDVSGPHTALIVEQAGTRRLWQPFGELSDFVYDVTRGLEKAVLGNKLRFEERNRDLGLCFGYEWKSSARHGFVRECTLENIGTTPLEVRLLDGVQNLLAADIEESMQLGFSCLLDAYKKNELIEGTSLALYTLTAQVIDRAEPRESLHAAVVWSYGLPGAKILLSSEQNRRFRHGQVLNAETEVRGKRGAYLLDSKLTLAPGQRVEWLLVLDVAKSQAQVSELAKRLQKPAELAADVRADVELGSQNLRRILAATDGFQVTADRLSSAHHLANVLFNDLRGGVYAQGYAIGGPEFARFVQAWSRPTYRKFGKLLSELPPTLSRSELAARVEPLGDPDLTRLAYEYLPLTFSRRHGDPSRPWNRFEIRVRDAQGNSLLGFQGNWRDIFQNWEALSLPYPDFVENIIVKFVNASTADGYNPYRITQEGIDWEVPEPDHPWAAIGYWGDHQVIYLTKLIELSRNHHPARLPALLERELFTYANVPYVIRPYAEIVANVRDTVVFDQAKQKRISARVAEVGADGKLLESAQGELTRVTLLEKLWVTALAKLGNLVPEGGLWLNTGRPEWNDANNALVGYGLSMVTTYYLERYLALLIELMEPLADRQLSFSADVALWLERTAAALEKHEQLLSAPSIDDRSRREVMDDLGGAASDFRATLYDSGLSGKRDVTGQRLLDLAELARRWISHTIAANKRPDGLFHAYNLLAFTDDGVRIEYLYEMLEGQVAALSTRSMQPAEALSVLDALAHSQMYRADQESYTLYPNRRLPRFLEKNSINEAELAKSPLLTKLLAAGDQRIVFRDAQGVVRFHESFASAERLAAALRASGAPADEIQPALDVYEATFDHHSFTGRSGTMFAYEGLGSIYWHMVAKLMLATSEHAFGAADARPPSDAVSQLRERYYTIRRGLGGFNKTPSVYGAFPLDPYSHTPAGSGARQPGMTGQVKEEVLTRFAELGLVVQGGRLSFKPLLLRRAEFLREPAELSTFDLSGAPLTLALEKDTLGFTYCQVPVVFHLGGEPRIVLTKRDGSQEIKGATLSPEASASLFARTGEIQRIDVWTQPGC